MASLITLTTLTALVSSGVSAHPSYDGRIIGGLLAPESSFPFLVGLSITKATRSDGTYWCGGALIAPNVVLTAAHCLYGATVGVKVMLGSHDRKNDPLHGEVIQVDGSAITIHENFNPDTIANDIAFIELPLNVTLTDDIQLIRLPSRYMDQGSLQGQVVTAAGWGKNNDTMKGIPKELHYVDVTIISQTECEETFVAGIIKPENICIDGGEQKGTCNGDSGGPLVYQAADDTCYLVGLTSFGSNHGCEKGFPSVFTRVTSFLDWISQHTGVDSE